MTEELPSAPAYSVSRSVRSRSMRSQGSKRVRKISMSPEFEEFKAAPKKAPRKLQGVSNDESFLEEELPLHQVYFQRAVQTMILLNSAQMGLEFSFIHGDWVTVWKVCDHFFTVFFLMEAIIKLIQCRCEYFTDKRERAWNIVDFFLVIVSVVDNWILKALGSSGSNLAAMKVIRLVRLSRVLRLLKEQKDLMMVVIGIVGSLKSMAWVGVLLLVVVYATAIACCTLIGKSEAYDDGEPAEVNFSSDPRVPSLSRAMFTLLNLSLGQGHMETFNPIYAKQIYLLPFLFVYVMVVTVGILNSIIGIICEKTAEAGRANLEEEEHSFRQLQREMVDNIKKLIWEMNEDGDGIISQDELDTAANDPKFIEMLKEINLPASFSVCDMHLMLDKDGDGELTEEEFADGMYDLVYSNEFQRQCILLRSLACSKRNLHYFRQEVKREFQDLRELLTRQDLKRNKAPESEATGAPEIKAVDPSPPVGLPPVFGIPSIGTWDFMDAEISTPMSRNPEGSESPQDAAMLKQVRANTLKAVAVGAWELLEQDGAVQKALADSGNLAAMKQVRARAMKAAADRQASRPESREDKCAALRAAAGGPLPVGMGFTRPAIASDVAPPGSTGYGELMARNALPGRMPYAHPSPREQAREVL